MPIIEIRKYVYRCCRCNTEVTEERCVTNKHNLPDGWCRVKVGPCGLTDYYRYEERCPDCAEKN